MASHSYDTNNGRHSSTNGIETNIQSSQGHEWNGTFGFDKHSTLIQCLQFIAQLALLNLPHEYTGIFYNKLHKYLSDDHIIVDDELTLLQEFVNSLCIEIYFWFIGTNRTSSYLISMLGQRDYQQKYRCFIARHIPHKNLFLIHMLDKNNNKHVVFQNDDKHISQEIEEFSQSVCRYNLSIQSMNQPSMDIEYNSEMISIDSDDSASRHIMSSTTDEGNILRNTSITADYSSSLVPLSTTTNMIQQTQICSHEILSLPAPTLLNQPKRLWHFRYFQCGVEQCLGLQIEGAKQGALFKIHFTKVPAEVIRELYMGVRVVRHNRLDHEQNLVLPSDTKVKKEHHRIQEKLDCFIFSDTNSDKFDKKTKCVYSKITGKENENGIKEMKISMVKFYQDDQLTKRLIEENKLEWSKLEFGFYKKVNNGKFIRFSPPTYSDLIQEVGRKQSDYVKYGLVRESLCVNGGQITAIKLDKPTDEENVQVYMNHNILQPHKFQIAYGYLSFVSPTGIVNSDLDIVIYQPDDNGLFISREIKIPYRFHDDHKDPCGVYEN